MTRFNLCLFFIGWVPCWFRLQTKATHAKAANQSHTCKALLQATAHGARTTGFCFVGFHVGFQLSGRSPWERYRGGPCWVPCWFPSCRVWGSHHGKGTAGGPCWVPCWLSCWVPAAWVWGEATMGKISVKFHVGFQVSCVQNSF